MWTSGVRIEFTGKFQVPEFNVEFRSSDRVLQVPEFNVEFRSSDRVPELTEEFQVAERGSGLRLEFHT